MFWLIHVAFIREYTQRSYLVMNVGIYASKNYAQK